MSETTAKCPHCGNLYKQYMHTVVDQSACPSCVAKATQNMRVHTFDNLINHGTGKPLMIKSYSECATYQTEGLGVKSGANIREIFGIGDGSSN